VVVETGLVDESIVRLGAFRAFVCSAFAQLFRAGDAVVLGGAGRVKWRSVVVGVCWREPSCVSWTLGTLLDLLG
jgi:hypothetical protein